MKAIYCAGYIVMVAGSIALAIIVVLQQIGAL